MNDKKRITIEPRWSKICFNIDETKALKLGLMIEINDNKDSQDFLLNISVWIQAKGYFSSNTHILKINNQEVNSLPIENHIDYGWGERQLLYFKNENVQKSILEKEMPFLIELSHVKNFNVLTENISYDTSIDYNTYEEEGIEKITNQNIIIPPLTQYKMIFMDGENLLEEKVKYFGIDFPMSIKPPIKKGFSFKGWKDELDESVSSVWIKNMQMSFQPIWERDIFNVTYIDNNGETIRIDKSDSKGSYKILNITPTSLKSGYRFKGWNIKPSQTEALIYLTDLTEDIVLFPVYELKTFTLVYDTKQTDYYKCINQDKFTTNYQCSLFDRFITSEIPVYDKRYKFVYWKIIQDGDPIYLYPGQAIPLTFLNNYSLETITLSVVREEVSYTATYYDMNNEFLFKQDFYHNEGFAISYNDEQNNISNWSLDIDFYDSIFKTGDLLPNKNLSLYALNEIPYFIDYTDGKGNVFRKEYSYFDGQEYTQFIPEKTRWYYDSDKKKYFNKWSFTANNKKYYFIPGFTHVLKTELIPDNKILTFNTVWGDNLLQEHYYLMNSKELSAENYIEYDNINDLKINNESNNESNNEYINFFQNGTINALELKENENNNAAIFYSKINHENQGEIHFSKFKQHNPVVASFLILALTSGDNVAYLTLNNTPSHTLFTL